MEKSVDLPKVKAMAQCQPEERQLVTVTKANLGKVITRIAQIRSAQSSYAELGMTTLENKCCYIADELENMLIMLELWGSKP